MKLYGTIVLAGALLLFPLGAFAQTADEDSKRAERTKQLESKVDDVRQQFQLLRQKLDSASDQVKSNIRAELDEVRKDLKTSYDELQSAYESNVQRLDESINKAWAEFENESEQAREMAADELNAIRAEWNEAVSKRQTIYKERVARLRGDLDEAEKQLKSAGDDASKHWQARRTEIRRQYQTYADQLRQSYHDYIGSLQNEVARINKNSASAKAEVNAEMMAKSDELNSRINEAYEEILAGYNDMSAKASDYVEQTYTRMKSAGDAAKGAIQSEWNEVSDAILVMKTEMAASYEGYRDALDQQIAALKTRADADASDAKGRINEMARQLEMKRQEAESNMVSAYKSAEDAIQQDIDRLNSELKNADDQARKEMIKAITKRQTELEKIKAKLR